MLTWKFMVGRSMTIPTKIVLSSKGSAPVDESTIFVGIVIDSAFIHRRAAFDIVLDVFWWTDAEKPVAQAFLDGWIALIEPMSNGHIYQNYPRLDQDDYGWRYWGDAQQALYAVKLKYDPTDAFRFAQCVKPVLREDDAAAVKQVLPTSLQDALNQAITYR